MTGKRTSAALQKGWVYILQNPASPGLLKIGCTERTPEIRARELSSVSGVVVPFTVVWAWPVSDCEAVERTAHAALSRYRVNRHREFFACSVPAAQRAIKRAARAWLRPAWLRLLVGPRHTAKVGASAWGRRGVADPVPGLVLVLLVLGAGLIAAFRPAPPAWLPGPVSRVVERVEGWSAPPTWLGR